MMSASFTTFTVFLLFASFLSTGINAADAPNSLLQSLINQLTSLTPGDLGSLAGKLGEAATYDYVVVGGGTGGTAIAVRLAQSGASVALVEAGEYYDFTNPIISSTPGLDVLLCGSDITDSNPLVDWEFVAKNQPGANNRPIHFARGKCVGGSSALNFMIYQRPTTESLQEWADVVNDDSYTFDQVLPYYEKSAQFTPPDESTRFSNATPKYNPSAFESTGGPLQVSYANYAQPFSTWLKDGFQEIGIDEADDFNSGKLFGAQFCTSTIRPSDQTRSSSEASYFQSALVAGISTLKAYTGTRAEKVLFDENQKSTGVQVNTAGVSYTLHAEKEVIVSAGAFQSPQILMVSGIGPRDQLEAQGIEVISELPGVGQNMWDHPTFGPSYPIGVDSLTKEARDVLYLTEQLTAYTTTHTGSLTNPVADYLAWEKIPSDMRSDFSAETQAKLAQFPSDWPEVEYISGAGYVGNFNNLFLQQPTDGQNYATILNVLITPLSRGNVTITSSSTADLPIINPAWLTDPADQELAVAAYKRSRQLFHSDAMAPVVTGPEAYPGTDVQTDEEILEAVKNSLITLWHPACTCKMGNSTDELAVLDSQARVKGVSGLRVVDASSFPFLPPGHPQSTIYMLAEKIADQMINS